MKDQVLVIRYPANIMNTITLSNFTRMLELPPEIQPPWQPQHHCTQDPWSSQQKHSVLPNYTMINKKITS